MDNFVICLLYFLMAVLVYSYQPEAVPVMFARLEALEKFDRNLTNNPQRIVNLTLCLLDELAKQAKKVCFVCFSSLNIIIIGECWWFYSIYFFPRLPMGIIDNVALCGILFIAVLIYLYSVR